MVGMLAEIAERQPFYYPFDERLREARSLYEQMPSGAPPQQRMPVVGNLAQAEYDAGNLDESIRLFEQIVRLLDPLPLSQSGPYLTTVYYFLAVGHLRAGVAANPALAGAGILPLPPGGTHDDPSHAHRAIDYLDRFLGMVPDTDPHWTAARWLRNVAAMLVGDYPEGVPARVRIEPEFFRSEVDFPRFANVAPRAGLATVSLAGGAAMDDFDGDGLLDVVTSTLDPRGQLRVFRNRGDGTFAEVTEAAGVTGILGGLNLIHADYDGDGDLDVFILRGGWLRDLGRHPNSLLRNDLRPTGELTFTDVTFEAGLGDVHYPTQAAAFADYDNDGDLDLYIGNEATEDRGQAYPSQLFRNEGDGTFVDVASAAGVENLRYSKGVAWGDTDDDGWVDLYVSNFAGANRLYRNDRDGTFTDVAEELLVTDPFSSFVPWFWDVDNDGDLDLLVNSYRQPFAEQARGPDAAYVIASHLGRLTEAEFPRLYLNDGAGSFTDVAGEWGLHRVTLPMGANHGDLDGDGYPDFYLGTGYPGREGMIPNVMYLNVPRAAGGRRFADVTYAGGFGHLEKGHGVAFADIDNDGDQDVFEQMGGLYPGDGFADALYANPGFGNAWIGVELEGREANRYGVGARIRVDVILGGGGEGEDGAESEAVDGGQETEGGMAARRSVHHLVGTGGSFGSDPLRAEIGLGRATGIETLEVRWPGSGRVQTFTDVPLNRFVRVVEGEDEIVTLERRSFDVATGER